MSSEKPPANVRDASPDPPSALNDQIFFGQKLMPWKKLWVILTRIGWTYDGNAKLYRFGAHNITAADPIKFMLDHGIPPEKSASAPEKHLTALERAALELTVKFFYLPKPDLEVAQQLQQQHGEPSQAPSTANTGLSTRIIGEEEAESILLSFGFEKSPNGFWYSPGRNRVWDDLASLRLHLRHHRMDLNGNKHNTSLYRSKRFSLQLWACTSPAPLKEWNHPSILQVVKDKSKLRSPPPPPPPRSHKRRKKATAQKILDMTARPVVVVVETTTGSSPERQDVNQERDGKSITTSAATEKEPLSEKEPVKDDRQEEPAPSSMPSPNLGVSDASRNQKHTAAASEAMQPEPVGSVAVALENHPTTTATDNQKWKDLSQREMDHLLAEQCVRIADLQTRAKHEVAEKNALGRRFQEKKRQASLRQIHENQLQIHELEATIKRQKFEQSVFLRLCRELGDPQV